jgi:hypothetical protein
LVSCLKQWWSLIDLEKFKCKWYLMKPYVLLFNLYFCYSNYFISIFINIYDFTRKYDFLVQTLKYTWYLPWMHVCFCFKSFQSFDIKARSFLIVWASLLDIVNVSTFYMSNEETFKLAQNNFEYLGRRYLFNCPRDFLILRSREYKEYEWKLSTG